MRAPWDDIVANAAEVIRERAGAGAPRVGIILGSGLGPMADAITDATIVPYSQIPGFPRPTIEGHSGRLHLGSARGTPVAVMQGRVHYYESGRADAMRVPIQALRAAGCDVLLLTNAAGGLRAEAAPGSLMLITDHINLIGSNPLVNQSPAERGGLPVFVDMVDAYDLALREIMLGAAATLGIALHQGVYACFAGPSFETPAEIRAAAVLGADAVGMSTVPEAILARQCTMRVAAISVIVNYGAGISAVGPSHAETMAKANAAAHDVTRLAMSFVEAVR